jgi:signal transduction histidine kinase
MPFAHLRRSFKTSTFRLTLVIAGLFLVCIAILFAAVDWYAMDTLQTELRTTVTARLAAIMENDAAENSARLVRNVNEALEQDPGAYVLLLGRDGQRLAGNLVASTQRPDDWVSLSTPRPAGPDGIVHQHPIIAKGVLLPNGGYLLVGQDAFSAAEVRELIAHAIIVGGVLTSALALAGGFLVSRGILNRLAGVGQVSQEIMHGDLSRRLPTRGTGDEFDQLVVGFNTLLDRIATLMETMRRVTNDVAHDLRTPLTRMRTRLEEVRRRPRRINEYEAAIDRSIADTEALLDTFAALLRIAQIEATTDTDTLTSIDASIIIATVAELYEPLAEERGQSVSPHGCDFTLYGDRELLIQMLGNLVENACLHTPYGSKIDFGATASGERLTFWVQDDGPGIASEEHERVFRPFYRLDGSRSKPGNGLGLSLVAAIAERHGGRVVLSDAHPGLRIEVRLPHRASVVCR